MNTTTIERLAYKTVSDKGAGKYPAVLRVNHLFCKMKVVPCILSLILPLACFAISACAPTGVMTYKSTEVNGRPYFEFSGSNPTMQIVDVSRPEGEKIWWNDQVLDHRSVDTSRHYRFELREGTAVYNRAGDSRGIAKHTDVSRVYDDQRLIYDASFCRVHSLIMQRTNRQETIDAESLPRGFDKVKSQRFPNSRFDHPRCASGTAYSILDWTCPQCSEAETVWLEKNSEPTRQ